jgi:hypothetical protein
MNPIQFRQQFSYEEHEGVKAHRDLKGILLFGIHSLIVYPYLSWKWLVEFLRIVLQETRSLFGRISVRMQENYHVVLGSGYESSASQHLLPCRRTQTRSACIPKLVAMRPWATMVDLELFLEGWDMGEAYASPHNNLPFCSAQMASSTQASVEYITSNN